jgi:DNA primase
VSSSNSGIDAKTRVLQTVDVVELIGRSVKLKRRGKDYVGLCPFHQEKTPSFHVKPDKQFFYCFGCKAAGNAIDFVVKRDRVEFKDALQILARQYNIDLPHRGASKEKTGQRQALLDANAAAAALFEKLLSHPQHGQPARDYLHQRGFTDESIKRFRIGYVPDAWDTLLTSEVARKFPPSLLQEAGLVKPRDAGGFYDTFRNRVVFPIRDESSRIIAFGGRIMPGAEDPAKYLNSPETALFSKGRSIFGIDLARERIVETRTVAVVEGYTDVVMSHQFGATNVVSILGTAMTEQHIAVLRRFADRVVLLFDADSAGDAAVNRAVELFLTQPIEIAIASMPDGVDPDEYLVKNGLNLFQTVLQTAQDALTYKWRQLVRQFEADRSLTGQQKAVSSYLEVLAGARGSGPVDAIRWGSCLARVSRLTQIPVEQLQRRFRARGRKAASARPSRQAPAREFDNADARAERWVLGILLAQPGHWQDVQQHIVPQDFTEERRSRLAQIYWDYQRDEGEPVFSEFIGDLPDPELQALAAELVEGVDSLEPVQALRDAIEHFRRSSRRKNEQEPAALHRRISSSTCEAEQIDLLRQLQEQVRQPDLRRIASTSGA